MNIQFDAGQMTDLVSAALMQSLDQSKREVLIQGAIKHLLTPEGNTYSSRRESPMETAFRSAVRNVAEKVAGDMMSNDPTVQAQLRELVQEALTRLMTTNREKTVDKLADAIAAGMAYRERD